MHSKVVVSLVGVVFCTLFTCSRAAGQAPMSLGTVDNPQTLSGGCPTNRYFYSDPNMVCYTTTVYCPNTDPLDLVYGVDITPGLPSYNGTIVMFAGVGGTYAGDDLGYFSNYAQNYLAAGYQIVQIAWGKNYPGFDWEYTNVNKETHAFSIRNAACRPATFLNYVRFGNGNPNVPIIWNATKGGMCGHGNSGGAGAMAYALAWYNAGAGGPATNGSGYLDKVVLENGPVFSDVFQGCEGAEWGELAIHRDLSAGHDPDGLQQLAGGRDQCG